jgi:pentatricopeptide repeat protein
VNSLVLQLNRSKLAKVKPTPFLDDEKQKSFKTFVALTPDKSGLSEGNCQTFLSFLMCLPATYKYDKFPKLDPLLFADPRMVKNLLNGDKPTSNGSIELSAVSATGRKTVRKREPLSEDEAVATVFSIWFTVFTTVVTALKKPKYLPNAFAVCAIPYVLFLIIFVQVLRKMMSSEIPIEMVIWRQLINTCGACKVPDQALRVLQAMQEAGVVADGPTYSALLKVFSQNGDLHRAYQALGNLPKEFLETKLDEDPGLETVGADAYGGMINLNSCVGQFEKSFPGITVSILEPCPSCDQKWADADIRKAWDKSTTDSSITCRECDSRFMPRFAVKFISPTVDEKHTIWCEYLSPLVLHREITKLLQQIDGNYISSSDFHRNSPTIFWNTVWHFSNLRLPVWFMIPWLKGAKSDNPKLKHRRNSVSATSMLKKYMVYNDPSISPRPASVSTSTSPS